MGKSYHKHNLRLRIILPFPVEITVHQSLFIHVLSIRSWLLGSWDRPRDILYIYTRQSNTFSAYLHFLFYVCTVCSIGQYNIASPLSLRDDNNNLLFNKVLYFYQIYSYLFCLSYCKVINFQFLYYNNSHVFNTGLYLFTAPVSSFINYCSELFNNVLFIHFILICVYHAVLHCN